MRKSCTKPEKNYYLLRKNFGKSKDSWRKFEINVWKFEILKSKYLINI